uniref:Proheparin-binding EGF-like growth factor n=1 Tax=Hucho hucho TaxID=62062 RepID=A0A4W5QKB7_9TELE
YMFPLTLFAVTREGLPCVAARREGKRKGNGKKRNPCLRKYKDYCIHGVCQYLRELREPSCMSLFTVYLCRCILGYSGTRCHIFSLPVTKEAEGYNRTVAVTVVAVVLSFLFLTVHDHLFIHCHTRYHKQGEYNFDNEEKVKLKTDAHP